MKFSTLVLLFTASLAVNASSSKQEAASQKTLEEKALSYTQNLHQPARPPQQPFLAQQQAASEKKALSNKYNEWLDWSAAEEEPKGQGLGKYWQPEQHDGPWSQGSYDYVDGDDELLFTEYQQYNKPQSGCWPRPCPPRPCPLPCPPRPCPPRPCPPRCPPRPCPPPPCPPRPCPPPCPPRCPPPPCPPRPCPPRCPPRPCPPRPCDW